MFVVHFGQQTVKDLYARLAEIDALERRLSDEKYALYLRIEEAEGRPDSHRARFARASLAGDLDAMNRLCAENEANHIREYGHEPDAEVRAEGRRIAQTSPGPASSADLNPGAMQ